MPKYCPPGLRGHTSALTACDRDAPSLDDDLAEIDDELALIVEQRRKEGLAKGMTPEAAAAAAGAPKKPMSEMTYEEKMQWVEDRKKAAIKRREQEALQKIKDSERTRRETGHAAIDLAEKVAEIQAKAAAEKKRREDAEKEKRRRELAAKEKGSSAGALIVRGEISSPLA
jgi:hypothetical protein